MGAPALEREREAWRGFLERELGEPVRVAFTRARKLPVQVRRTRPALEVRLHGMFAAAPPDVRQALTSWLRSGRRAPRACRTLDDWIAESLERSAPPAREHVARGACHDLARIASALFVGELAREFADATRRPALAWGRRAQSRTRHSLRLGSFDLDGRVVRIHPVLDQPAVPEWFVRFVVFHELLHAHLPPRRGADGRTEHHHARFRARERAHPDCERALEWERRHIRALIRSAKSGRPLAAALDVPPAAPVPQALGPHASAPQPRGTKPLGTESSGPEPLGPGRRAARLVQGLLFDLVRRL